MSSSQATAAMAIENAKLTRSQKLCQVLRRVARSFLSFQYRLHISNYAELLL